MDKRILVAGCILAVAILLGVSFTSVVGYSSNKSNYVRASPLFNLRTNRAIENGEDVTTCEYVGKSKGLTIPISEWNNLGALRQQLLEKFKRMDEEELKDFRKSIIRLLNPRVFAEESNRIKQLTPNEDETSGYYTCGYTLFACLMYLIIGLIQLMGLIAVATVVLIGLLLALLTGGTFLLLMFITLALDCIDLYTKITGCTGYVTFCPNTWCYDTFCETFCYCHN